MKAILVVSLMLMFLDALSQTELKRQPEWGAIFISGHPNSPGMIVRRLQPGSILEKSGVREYDLVIGIGNVRLSDPYISGKTLRSFRAGDEVTLSVLRNGKISEHLVILQAKPLENYKNIQVTYGSVVTEKGDQVRTIFTRPKSSVGKIPALMIVQWLSCDPVEINTEKVIRSDSLLFQLITESGLAVMRIEKPGMGDSRGPDCTECDYDTELSAYRAGMMKLKQMDGVDTNAIYVMGISIGASSAPLLFGKENIKGYIVSGGFSKTWFEHMLELERNRLALSGSKPGEITNMIRKYSEFYDEYLNHKKTPAEVLKERPHLNGIWYEGDKHQYERPAAYYQQVQEKNIAEAWTQVNCPVLVIYGEYDWIMSRADHREIADLVNARNPGTATFVEIKKMSHNFTIHPSMGDSFSGANASYNAEIFLTISKWLALRKGD